MVLTATSLYNATYELSAKWAYQLELGVKYPESLVRPRKKLELSMSKDKYTFLHLSDIHFGQERDGTIYVHEDIRAQLLADCKSAIDASGIAPDGILITGDLAFKGSPDEYEQAGKWIDQLAQAVRCEVILVCTIPGNHDIDRTKIHHFCKLAHADMRTKLANEVDACLDGMLADEEVSNPLLPKIAAYREFAARFGCDFESVKKPIWRKEYMFHGGRKLVLVGMTSVQISDSFDAEGQMILGNNQYVIPTEDNVEHVVLVHHPIEWLKDRSAARPYLMRARVLMVGHEHELRIHKIQDDLGREQLQIYAGATNPPERGMEYRYNWIDFSLVEDRGNVMLRVNVHPRLWDRNQTNFVADSTRLAGSSTFDLRCSKYLPMSVAATATPAPTGKRDGDKECETMADPDDSSFQRLQYFFWTYLKWDERLKALVDVDVLPAVLAQPMPQTLERLALDTAKKNDRLEPLWDKVMESVPTEKRAPNPFRTN